MNTGTFTIHALFQQLGLESSDKAIEQFLYTHAPLPNNLPLHQAHIWTTPQALFLQESIQDDADWAYAVDQLNSLLRLAQ